MNKRRVGGDKERQAAEYLTGKGMRVLETNFRCRQGEIDLICRHRGYLVFVEVKYRSASEKGYALEAVDYRKQLRICRVADYYRYVHGLGDGTGVRYDVVGIQGSEIQWVQNAFPHIYARGY
ncbi:YraN family protein [uncultured Acetatifactor sp.]|uniref:YraN family protein n=1 Tax=uncultured Acetatifactor sp. TaxID=1671927 RepID=UPI0026080892|nr:YraN family protein [uncultured Acetatifactor sp.]